MNDRERYLISQLEEETGQQRRTIHHYISRGLLPKAEGSGPKAYYTREHYLRLKLISLLVEAGVGTDLIQTSLAGWSLEDMERLVNLAEGQRLDDLDKLSRWLTRAEMPFPEYEAELLLSEEPETHPAKRIARDLTRLPRSEWTELREVAPGKPEQQRMNLGFESSLMSTRAVSDDRSLSEPPRAPLPRPDSWERIRIGDDLEIAYRAKSDRRMGKKIYQLKELLRTLFAEELARDSPTNDSAGSADQD